MNFSLKEFPVEFPIIFCHFYLHVNTKDVSLRLSPAYDIVCSKLVIPNELDSALTIHGKQNKITRSDLLSISDFLGIPEKVRDNIFHKMKALLELANHHTCDL